MHLKSYEAYGLILALAGNMDGVSVSRVSIPMVGANMYCISTKDSLVDISINPNETEEHMDVFRDSIAQLYNYRHKANPTDINKLSKGKTLEMRTVDILNENKYQIADYHPNPPMRLRGTYSSFLDMFKSSDFASQDFATLHTATTLSASLYQDLNTTTISEMWKAINDNQDTVEDYIEMGEELDEIYTLIENGQASDIHEAFEILHADDIMEDDDEMEDGKGGK